MKRFVFSIAFFLVPFCVLRAADAPSPEMKLRENLRSTMLQLRQVQGERDALQGEKTQLEADKKELGEKVDALTKQAAANQEAADKKAAELAEKLLDRENDLVATKESLEKWKAAQKLAADTAQKKETERAKLAQKNVELERRVEDQQRRNLAMYRTGMDILGRYERFGLGTALTAREPFVGTTRVKLENLVQDLGDKLEEQRIKPEPAPSPEKTSAAKPKS